MFLVRRMNLFEQKHVKGWIPVYQENYTGTERRREQRGNRTIAVSENIYITIIISITIKCACNNYCTCIIIIICTIKCACI